MNNWRDERKNHFKYYRTISEDFFNYVHKNIEAGNLNPRDEALLLKVDHLFSLLIDVQEYLEKQIPEIGR
jgi:hypothetical protein